MIGHRLGIAPGSVGVLQMIPRIPGGVLKPHGDTKFELRRKFRAASYERLNGTETYKLWVAETLRPHRQAVMDTIFNQHFEDGVDRLNIPPTLAQYRRAKFPTQDELDDWVNLEFVQDEKHIGPCLRDRPVTFDEMCRSLAP